MIFKQIEICLLCVLSLFWQIITPKIRVKAGGESLSSQLYKNVQNEQLLPQSEMEKKEYGFPLTVLFTQYYHLYIYY